MLLTATLLGLIAALGILDGRLLGVSMIDRPLVMCALTGLVCLFSSATSPSAPRTRQIS